MSSFLYIASGILLIHALAAAPSRSRYAGVAAVSSLNLTALAAFMLPACGNYFLCIAMLIIGALIGAAAAKKQPTASQAITLFSGLSGLTAVLLSFAITLNPEVIMPARHMPFLTLAGLALSCGFGALAVGSTLKTLSKKFIKPITLPAHYYIVSALLIAIVGLSFAFIILDGYFEILAAVAWLAAMAGITLTLPLNDENQTMLISIGSAGAALAAAGIAMGNAVMVIAGGVAIAAGRWPGPPGCHTLNPLNLHHSGSRL